MHELAKQVADYKSLKHTISDLDGKLKAIEDEIKRYMGDAEELQVDGDTVHWKRYEQSLAVSGLGTGKIATRLNEESVPTIRELWPQVNPDITWDCHYAPNLPPAWRSGAVRGILTNKTYIGTFVGHKFTTKSFKKSQDRQNSGG